MAYPNKFSRQNYVVKELPSGDLIRMHVMNIEGPKAGPHVHIQSSVHGAEIQGNAVIYELLQYFKKHAINGSVTLIPCANPMGLNTKMGTHTYGRFNPVSGQNWNRCYEDWVKRPQSETSFSLEDFVRRNLEKDFLVIKRLFKKEIVQSLRNLRSYLGKRGINENKDHFLFLQELAAPADIVLDLHTGPVATRYLYAAEFEQESAKHFLFPHTLIMPNEFASAMDEACFGPWVYLRDEFKRQNKKIAVGIESYTVELGSEEIICLEKAKQDAARILNYLSYKGLLDHAPPLRPTAQYVSELKDYVTYYAPDGGLVEYLKQPGEQVKKGEVLARTLRPNHIHEWGDLDHCLHEIKAINDCIIVNHNPSSNVTQGMELFQVMENYQKWN